MNAEKFMNRLDESEWIEKNFDEDDLKFTKEEVIAFAELYAKYKLNNK
jgi:hypothetical protein